MANEEEVKALEDALIHGSGFLVNGKHVPFAVITSPEYEDRNVRERPILEESVMTIIAKYGKPLRFRA